MPSVPPASTTSRPSILVTGANGYIGMWVVRRLLEDGYAVRAAIRTKEKGEKIVEAFAKHKDFITFVVVPDIVKDGAYDDAVKDVDGIAHTASPLTSTSGEPNEYIIPAVKGTVGILQSALKFGTNVKRIVITSSCGAIIQNIDPRNSPSTVILDEKNWADEFVKIVEEKRPGIPEIWKYRASKTLAERTAWEFYKTHKSEIGWDLVSLNPSVVLGPSLCEVPTPQSLNLSLEKWYEGLFVELPVEYLKATYAYVDIRDTAEAHVLALTRNDAGGHRFVISAGAITFQATRNLVATIKPELLASGKLLDGDPNIPNDLLYNYNNSKSQEILGLKYRGLEEMASDTLNEWKEKGWFD